MQLYSGRSERTVVVRRVSTQGSSAARVTVNGISAELPWASNHNLEFHLFLDGSVAELFATTCMHSPCASIAHQTDLCAFARTMALSAPSVRYKLGSCSPSLPIA